MVAKPEIKREGGARNWGRDLKTSRLQIKAFFKKKIKKKATITMITRIVLFLCCC
jgi:hypothetical protein